MTAYRVKIRKTIIRIKKQKATREESLMKMLNIRLLIWRNIRKTVIRISLHSSKAVNEVFIIKLTHYIVSADRILYACKFLKDESSLT